MDLGVDSGDVSLDELLGFLDASDTVPTQCDSAHELRDSESAARLHPSMLCAESDDSLTSTHVEATEGAAHSAAAHAQRRRSGARTHGATSTKRTLECLRMEVHQLTEELHSLHASRGHSAGSRYRDVAMTEHAKRRRAERECRELREAIYTQTQFLRGLRSVFISFPSLSMGLNVCQHLHHYSRLPRDKNLRWSEYAALADEKRVHFALDVLRRELESSCGSDCMNVSISRPYIQTHIVPNAGGVTVTTLSTYAVDTQDVGAVLRGACVAVRGIISSKGKFYECDNVVRDIVDADAGPRFEVPDASKLLYRVMSVQQKHFEVQEALNVEARVVQIYKQTDEYSAMLWDFVDEDELHPVSETTDITRESTGICLIRRQQSVDGADRVVYHALSTRHYRFHYRGAHDRLQQFHDATLCSMPETELTFRDIMLDQIATEREALALALTTLRATV